MPSKFSHSVVLAHYSSLGLIDLPNSQHVAYLNSCPPPISRAPGTVSKAQSDPNTASHAGNSNENVRQSSVAGQITHVSPLGDPSERLQIIGKSIIIGTGVKPENGLSTSHPQGHEKKSSASPIRKSDRSTQRNSKQLGIYSTNASDSDSKNSVTARHAPRPVDSDTSSFETCVWSSRIMESQYSSEVPQGASYVDQDAGNYRAQSLQQARRTGAPQPTQNPLLRKSPGPNSTIAAQVTQDTILDARQASRNASADTVETHRFNPLPELADFDGFSDSNEAGRMHEISITSHSPLSTARSSTMLGWSSEAPLVAPRRDQNEHQRPRALLLGLNSPSTTTPQSTRLFNHELSSHSSLDSSSLCSLDIPIVERAHPLRANKGVVSRSAQTSDMMRHWATSNDEHSNSYNHSLSERGSPLHGDAATRNLEYGCRSFAPRQPHDSEQGRRRDADTLLEVNAGVPPHTAIRRVQNGASSPLAQIDMMLQKREEEANSKDGNAEKKTLV